MELRQLQIFCSAAETLNFTQTGSKLGYAQSNITGQILQLEQELQVKLFDRLGRRIELTHAGKLFWQNARQILALCEQAKREIAPETFNGIITIGVAETLCLYWLPEILTTYRQSYPAVEIRVQTDCLQNVIQAIRSNHIDLGLVLTDNIQEPDLEHHPLLAGTMTAVISPEHPLAQKGECHVQDLTAHCLIVTLPGCGYRPLIFSLLTAANVVPGSLMELSSVGAIKQCVRCGLGVAILPLISVLDELKHGQLQEIKLAQAQFNIRTHLLYHRKKWLSSPMQAFIELCHKYSNINQASANHKRI